MNKQTKYRADVHGSWKKNRYDNLEKIMKPLYIKWDSYLLDAKWCGESVNFLTSMEIFFSL